MKICYIAPVAAKTIAPPMVDATAGSVEILIELLKGNPQLLEDAIANAINKTIVIPFISACTKGWIIFVEVSGVITLFVALAGLISYIGGVKKGKSVTVVSFVVYLIIQMLNYFIFSC